MELQDYLRILRRRWMLVVASVLVVVAAAAAYTFTVTPMYQSTARLFISSSADGGDTVSGAFQGAQFSQQRVSSYAEFVKDADLAGVVVEDLDLSLTPTELRDRVSATVSPETVIIDLQAQDPSPARPRRSRRGTPARWPTRSAPSRRPSARTSRWCVPASPPPRACPPLRSLRSRCATSAWRSCSASCWESAWPWPGSCWTRP